MPNPEEMMSETRELPPLEETPCEIKCSACKGTGNTQQIQDNQPGLEWCDECGGAGSWMEDVNEVIIRERESQLRTALTERDAALAEVRDSEFQYATYRELVTQKAFELGLAPATDGVHEWVNVRAEAAEAEVRELKEQFARSQDGGWVTTVHVDWLINGKQMTRSGALEKCRAQELVQAKTANPRPDEELRIVEVDTRERIVARSLLSPAPPQSRLEEK